MKEIPPKCLENIQKSIAAIKIADHIVYVTFPIIKDKRLLLKALDKTCESVILIINSILQYEYFWDRIKLSENATDNFEIFTSKCSIGFKISPLDIADIKGLFQLVENHRKSPIEFLRKEKIVILNEDLKTSTLDCEKIKEYLKLTKQLIEKAKIRMSLQ